MLEILPCWNFSFKVLLHPGVWLYKKQILEDLASAGIYGDNEEAGFSEVKLFGVYLKKKKQTNKQKIHISALGKINTLSCTQSACYYSQ